MISSHKLFDPVKNGCGKTVNIIIGVPRIGSCIGIIVAIMIFHHWYQLAAVNKVIGTHGRSRTILAPCTCSDFQQNSLLIMSISINRFYKGVIWMIHVRGQWSIKFHFIYRLGWGECERCKVYDSRIPWSQCWHSLAIGIYLTVGIIINFADYIKPGFSI